MCVYIYTHTCTQSKCGKKLPFGISKRYTCVHCTILSTVLVSLKFFQMWSLKNSNNQPTKSSLCEADCTVVELNKNVSVLILVSVMAYMIT